MDGKGRSFAGDRWRDAQDKKMSAATVGDFEAILWQFFHYNYVIWCHVFVQYHCDMFGNSVIWLGELEFRRFSPIFADFSPIFCRFFADFLPIFADFLPIFCIVSP
jgi:hypothetical protein